MGVTVMSLTACLCYVRGTIIECSCFILTLDY